MLPRYVTGMNSRKASSVAAGALIISGGTLLSRLLGYVREKMLLGAFSDSNVTGAYNSAFMVPDLLYYLLAGGAMSAAFIPVFTNFLSNGKDHETHETGSTISSLLLVAMTIGALLEIVFAPWVVRLIAPGYRPGSNVFRLTVNLTRLMCVMVIFTAQSGHFTGILNSYKHFLTPVLVWNVYNLSIILGISVFSKLPILGATHGHPSIYGVGVGVVLGAICMAVIQLPVVFKYGFRLTWALDLGHAGVRRVLKLFAPVMVGLSLSQVNLMAIPLIIGTLLGAPAVTDIRAANRLVMLPFGLFAIAISTAAFPKLAQQVAMGATKEFRETIGQSMRAILLLSVPATLIMFVLAEPLTYCLWGGDAFSQNSVQASAFVLMFFAWNLLGLSVVQIINRAYYSLHDTITPVIAGVGMVAVNIPLSWYLAVKTPFRYGGVAMATTITTAISTLILLELLRRRLNGLDGRALLYLTAKIIFSSLLMGMVVYFGARFLAPTLHLGTQDIKVAPVFRWPAPFLPFSKESDQTTNMAFSLHERLLLLIHLAIPLFIGMMVYIGALWVMRVKELCMIIDRLKAKVRKRPATV